MSANDLARELVELRRDLDRLHRIENAALRVASSRRDGIVTDRAALDLLDAALEDVTPAARSASHG